jgi:hypothetical protein
MRLVMSYNITKKSEMNQDINLISQQKKNLFFISESCLITSLKVVHYLNWFSDYSLIIYALLSYKVFVSLIL